MTGFLVLSDLTLAAIQAEATRARSKHGPYSMMGDRHTDATRLAILVEEVGEAAHELTYDTSGPGHHDRLVRELIQVAAMAASWVEVLEHPPSGCGYQHCPAHPSPPGGA